MTGPSTRCRINAEGAALAAALLLTGTATAAAAYALLLLLVNAYSDYRWPQESP
ncbi:MAG: hypothetical protein JWO69_1998 [Thermoleophilia bacterium]|nr:hypothetical protein [Thermoleophilia bacterium]